MTNKTPLSILYEYACQVFKTNPRFEVQEKNNAKDPFLALVYINDKLCGKGSGNSKKAAKNNAAEEALKVLIPDYKGQESQNVKKNSDDTYTFFDGYDVEHSHVYQLSQNLGSPLPYDVLLTCLKYNFAINATRNRKDLIEEEIRPIKFRNCLYRMKLAQYEVEVNCARKKEGRQLAAQKVLKQMHTHVQTWGGILRLYGSRVAESYLKMNDEASDGEEQTTSQTTKKTIEPNKDLLEKLKEEMRKLKKSTKSIAKIELNYGDKKQHESIMSIKQLIIPSESKSVDVVPPITNDSDVIKFSDGPTITQMMHEGGLSMDFY